MKQTRKLLAIGAIALAAGVFSACGGGSGAGSDVPTNGLLGELPAVAANYLPEINKLQEQRWNTSSEENREEIAKKEDELKAKWNEAIKAIPSLEGVEIPLEAAEGLPIRLEGNLKITLVTIKDDDVSIKAETTSIITEETPCLDYDFSLVAFDSDGNPLLLNAGSAYSTSDDNLVWKGGNASYKKDAQGKTMFVTSTPKGTIWKNPAGWAKLAKVVIMDNKSEAFKKAEEHVNAAEKTTE